ncbi:hypothetical protein [Alienimonas chondri]|uniref:AsmA-like C-terminal domain-containing protein n=1 Tax=Alienimonas chondri TaxID=2681879 RepID=A0ABX1VH21_9PLAN|nr:hypothetical protein [Alienimonas chondri]NNJ26751.1 hypothetical protein [Alienimonas chondri]
MIRRTVGWLGALCAVLAVGGGAAAWHYFERADAMTRDAALAAFAELAPNAVVTIDGASFDWEETVTVTGMTLRPAGDTVGGTGAPIVVPEMRITLDRERFREAERIEVRALTLVRPTLTLVRHADGRWNLSDLLPIVTPDPAPACPAWEIRDATVRLVFESGGDAASDSAASDSPAGHGPLAATLHGLNISLLPDSKRSYRIRGTGGVAGTSDATLTEVGGGVDFDGAIDLDRGRWRLAGKVRGLELGGGLLADAALGSPEFQAGLLAAHDKFTAAERKLAGESNAFPVGSNRGPIRVVSADPSLAVRSAAPPTPRGPVRLTDFGLDGDLAAQFSFSADSLTETPEYDVTVVCRSGTLVNRFLPFPLSNVRGAARIADGEVRLLEATGRHGETVARAEGVFRPSPIGMAGRVTFSAERVPVTRADGARLPDVLRKLHEILTPTGKLDIAVATLEAAPSALDGELRNRWTLKELDLTVADGTVRPSKFPYPVENVRGTAKTDADGVLQLDFRGTASGRPGMFRGWVRNPGREFEFSGEARVVGVPLDRTFRDACPAPVRESVEHMALTGTAGAELTLHRPPGLFQPVHWTINAAVADGSIRPMSFPYQIDGLSGGVRFDSRENVWRFETLRGAHGPAELTGTATFDLARRPGRLALDLSAVGTRLDRALHDALPEAPREVWDALGLSHGYADAKVAVRWLPGGPVRVDLPVLRVADASLTPNCFPLPLRGVNATGSYLTTRSSRGSGGTVAVDQFSYAHADRAADGPILLRTTGRLEATHDAAGDWTLSLDDLVCDGFVTGPAFRAALTDAVRAAVDSLNLTGPIDLRIPSLQMRGVADGSAEPTAAWRAIAALDGNTADLGPTVRLGRGTVTCEGKYDGELTTLAGELRTATAELYEHTLTDVTVPYRMRGDALLVGSPDDPNGEHISAMAYGGVLRADVSANLARGPAYRLSAELNGAKLGEYALQKMGGARNLQGNLRGSVTVAGHGSDARSVTGSGNVEIKPAALGELNVVLRLFKAVNMNDPTMFHSAAAKFDLAGETVSFQRIDLLGEAISFVGRGRVGWNGGLDLQFYSKAPSSWMPLVRVLSTGWVGVNVAGTVRQPVVDTFSPAVEGSLQAFLTPLSPLLSKPNPPRTAVAR